MRITGLLLLLFSMTAFSQDNYNLIVGTYTNACESKGLYVYDFNVNTLSFKEKNSTEGVVNPSYFTVNKSNNVIYSVNEDGTKSDVTSFKYNPATGKLQYLNKKDSEGADPCYIINDDKNVIVANYSGGSIAVFGKKNDGALTDAKQVIRHTGSSINKDRQEKAHVHMVYFSPDKKYIFSNDLGEDKIYIYSYNPDGGANTLTFKESIYVKPGSGPRHLVFNPNGIFFYVINELSATIGVYSYSYEKPQLIQELSLYAKDCTDFNSAAHISFSKDGKYLYATNRGDANTITVFKVHSNGMINQVQQITTGGEGPRNFVIDPTDNYLLVAHQYTHNIIIFKRDKITGMLTETGKKIDVCSPVCLKFTANK
ncbi:lactonase family protein [Flavobacterium sp. AG291]|uniref:lactonase family protein n=1 Tax=Flavobacterium sp. AG291 TaxID=2184000 RepID=UPI000E2D550F|nr:lactonase family protein [Flavobacterium sp. AG291]RDI14546.1 6-phosphogluconolactonase [Flavobacterium sp. AG291]